MANPILVIDNDPTTARIVEEQLGLTSLGVLAVTSLVEGVELAQKRPPCLVFLNIAMTDAADVARHLKEQLAAFVLVLLRQADGPDDSGDVPADLWMSKPLDLQEVRRIVGTISEEVAALPPPQTTDDVRRRDPRRRPQTAKSPPGVSHERPSPSPSAPDAPLPQARDDPGPREAASPAPHREGDTMTPQSQQQLEASQREAQQLAQKVQGLEARLNVARTKHYEQVAAIQVLESRAKLLEDEALEKATALRNAQIEQASLHKELEALRAKLENAQGGSPVAAAAETTADVVLLKAELKAANDQLQKARGDAEAQWAEAKARVSEAQGRSQKAADAAAQAAQAAELVAQHVKAMDKRLKVAVSRAQKSEQRVDELREAAEGHDALVNELVAARETIDQLQDALARAHAGETSHSPPDPAKNPSRVADQAHERSDLERKEDKDVELGSAPADEDVAGDEAPASDVPLASDVAQESQDDLTEQLATAQRERDELASIVGKLKADLELPAEDDITMGAPQHPAPMTRRETEATDGQWRAGYFIVEAENVVLRQNIARLEGAGGDANTSLELVLDDIIRILKAQREDFEQEVARWQESRASFGLQMQKWVEFAQSVSPSQEGEVTMDSLLEPLQDTLEVANRAIDMAQGLLEEQHDSMVQRRQA